MAGIRAITSASRYISLTLIQPIALSTTFTPASSCYDHTFTVRPKRNDTLVTAVTKTGNVVLNAVITRGYSPACYPPYFDMLGLPQAGDYTYYSPGVCPSGYTTKATALVVDEDETYATCCPPSMDLHNTICYQNVFTESAVIVNITESSTLREWDGVATPVVVAWRSADVSLWSAPSTLNGSAPSTSPSVTGSSSTTSDLTETSSTASGLMEPSSTLHPPSSATPTQPQQPNSLSPGSKTGIGVGVGLGGTACLLAVGFWLLRRRSRIKKKGESDFTKPELSGEGVEKAKPHVEDVEELGHGDLHEAGGVSRIPEMGPKDIRAELEGDWRGHEAAADSPGDQGARYL